MIIVKSLKLLQALLHLRNKYLLFQSQITILFRWKNAHLLISQKQLNTNLCCTLHYSLKGLDTHIISFMKFKYTKRKSFIHKRVITDYTIGTSKAQIQILAKLYQIITPKPNERRNRGKLLGSFLTKDPKLFRGENSSPLFFFFFNFWD